MRFRLRILPSSVRASTRRQANSLFAKARKIHARLTKVKFDERVAALLKKIPDKC